MADDGGAVTALAHWSRRAQPKSLLSMSDEWKSQAKLYAWANRRYGPFLLDAAAAEWNHQCARYLTKEQNALRHRWAKRNWCNPPYSRGNKARFCHHARAQVLAGDVDLTCLLLHSSALVVFARPGVLRPLVQAPGHFHPQGAA